LQELPVIGTERRAEGAEDEQETDEIIAGLQWQANCAGKIESLADGDQPPLDLADHEARWVAAIRHIAQDRVEMADKLGGDVILDADAEAAIVSAQSHQTGLPAQHLGRNFENARQHSLEIELLREGADDLDQVIALADSVIGEQGDCSS